VAMTSLNGLAFTVVSFTKAGCNNEARRQNPDSICRNSLKKNAEDRNLQHEVAALAATFCAT